MSHYINPRSVECYLSGICHSLEAHYPEIRESRRHPLVLKALKGCKKLRHINVTRKRALSRADLCDLQSRYRLSDHYDDRLFVALVFTGFHALLRLGELVWPDNSALHDYWKVILRISVTWLPLGFTFLLPGHKADRFFEGNRVVVQKTITPDDPATAFQNYLTLRDRRWPFNPELWLREDGSVPTRRWFITRLRRHFPRDVAGHSLRAGGATALAEAGISLPMIQALGRWSSDAFRSYIRHHPMILHCSYSSRS